MLFKEIIGQEKIKKRLIQTVKDNRISHAQLFLGPEGSGKLALAIAYAQYICCENKKNTNTIDDSCGSCLSCKKYQKLIHPDLHFVFPVAKTKKVDKDSPVSDDFIYEWRTSILESPYIQLNQWLELINVENKQGIIYTEESNEIIKKLNLKSFESEYKVMIIWMPEKMHTTAANKLLLMIEEPPPKTLFLLVSENAGQIIQTILSRTQLIKIPKIDNNSLLEYIRSSDKFDLKEQEINNIVRLANGNYIKALDIINSSHEHSYNFEMFKQLMRNCYKNKILDIIKWVDEISKVGREKQKSFLLFSLRMIRENFILNIKHNEIVYLTDEEADFSQKFSPFINQQNIFQLADELNKAHYHIERNANNKIVFLDLSLRLTKLLT